MIGPKKITFIIRDRQEGKTTNLIRWALEPLVSPETAPDVARIVVASTVEGGRYMTNLAQHVVREMIPDPTQAYPIWHEAMTRFIGIDRFMHDRIRIESHIRLPIEYGFDDFDHIVERLLAIGGNARVGAIAATGESWLS